MDAKYLAEIKARERAATPGPWVVRENKSFGVQSENKNIASCFRRENENFIAHARTDIPALIQQHEQDEKRIAELKKALELASIDKGDYEGAEYWYNHFIQQANKEAKG